MRYQLKVQFRQQRFIIIIVLLLFYGLVLLITIEPLVSPTFSFAASSLRDRSGNRTLRSFLFFLIQLSYLGSITQKKTKRRKSRIYKYCIQYELLESCLKLVYLTWTRSCMHLNYRIPGNLLPHLECLKLDKQQMEGSVVRVKQTNTGTKSP